jgi:Pectate lyase superfamily protein
MKLTVVRLALAGLLMACGLCSPSGTFILASPIQRDFDVRDFGATGDGKTLDTAAITKAIRAANAAGGGHVIFPPGVYLTGTFELLSNVTLDVEAGAVIQGSKNVTDYASIDRYGFGKTYGTNSTGEGNLLGIIVARKAQNIAIVGQGVIDGSGDDFFDFNVPHNGIDFDPKYTRQGADFMKGILELGDGPVETKTSGRPGTMIVFAESRNILVRDITFRNAPNWTFHLDHSQGIVVTGVHISNDLLLPNNDGIDCLSCKDAHFSDCDIHAGDDDFAFYGSENVGVTNSSLESRSASIRMESTRYATFSNLTIHSNRGIGIFERSGTTAHVLFSSIVIDTKLLTGHWWGKAEPIFIAVGPPTSTGAKPEVRDVRFTNITGEAEGGIVAYGDPNAWVHDIVFDQVKFRIRAPRPKVSEMAGGNFDFRWTATEKANAVFKHDIPGLYARYIDGFDIRGLTIEWADDVPAYFSNAIECEDFKRLTVEGFYGRQAPHTAAKESIVLRRGQDVTIRNSKAAAGTSIFLSGAGITGEGLFSGNDLRGASQAFADKNEFALFGNLMPEKH